MNLTDKRIVVIGGAGLIGSHIVDRLVEQRVREVVVVDNFVRGSRRNLEHASSSSKLRIIEGSMTDRAFLDAVLAGTDGVFLLAALWLGECVAEPRSAIEVNVMGTWNVIEAAMKANVQRIVFSSSASVYGNAITTPMSEEHPFNNRTMYGATKIAGEQLFRAMNEQYKLPYVGMRYMNIYGPRMDYKGTYVSVIMKVLDRIEQGLPPIIFGDGSQAYDFIHVEDAAHANMLAMGAAVVDEFFNVGMGVKTTIRELVDMLLDITGSSLTPEFRPEEMSFVTHRVGSIDKAERLLGFRAATPLYEGLKSVVAWRKADRALAGSAQ